MSYYRAPALGLVVDDDSGDNARTSRDVRGDVYYSPDTRVYVPADPTPPIVAPIPIVDVPVDHPSDAPPAAPPADVGRWLTAPASAPDVPSALPVSLIPVPDPSILAPDTFTAPLPAAGGKTEPTPPRVWLDSPSTPSTGGGDPPPPPPPPPPPATTDSGAGTSSGAGGSGSAGAPADSGGGFVMPTSTTRTRMIGPRDRATDLTPYDVSYGTGSILAPEGAPTVADRAAAEAAAAPATSNTKTLVAVAAGVAILLLMRTR